MALILTITCFVILSVIALVFYVVHRARPSRFKISTTVLKLFSLSIEIDSADKPDMPPDEIVAMAQGAEKPLEVNVGREAHRRAHAGDV